MRGQHVLVVDDDPYIRRLVTVVLEHHGVTVYAAGNGERALAIALAASIDVVLLDISMPILDGPGFVDALRAKGVQVPIVVMSGVLGAKDWARKIDACAILFKPFSMSELLAVVQAAFDRQSDVGSGPIQSLLQL